MSDATNSKGQGLNQDYEIGYGRPPKDTQFPPGQSGNPKGRKRKPQSIQVQMEKILQKKVTITEGGKTKLLSRQEVILRNLANKAAKADLKAVAFIFNLLKSPEYAETDTIDQNSLSPIDQAMFEDMLKQIMGPDDFDPADPSSFTEEEITETDAVAEKEEGRSMPSDPWAGSSGDE